MSSSAPEAPTLGSDSPDPDAPGPDAPGQQSPAARCQCGHTRDHYMVSPEATHTFWGWVLISIGISSKPIHMAFRCRKCQQIIETTRDPRLMRNYRA